MRVAINGFGWIGKLVFRAFLEHKIKDVDIVAINELGSIESSFHLLKFDSTHGQLSHNIKKTKNSLKYNNKNILFYAERDPKNLPWKKLNIDIVLECSGIFTSKENLESLLSISILFWLEAEGIASKIKALSMMVPLVRKNHFRIDTRLMLTTTSYPNR